MTTAQGLSKAVATAVSDAIKADRRSQRDVADAAGIPLVTLSRKLAGHRPFTLLELAAVAEVLDVSVTDLMLRAERALTHGHCAA